jgi:hypothetical protein
MSSPVFFCQKPRCGRVRAGNTETVLRVAKLVIEIALSVATLLARAHHNAPAASPVQGDNAVYQEVSAKN